MRITLKEVRRVKYWIDVVDAQRIFTVVKNKLYISVVVSNTLEETNYPVKRLQESIKEGNQVPLICKENEI